MLRADKSLQQFFRLPRLFPYKNISGLGLFLLYFEKFTIGFSVGFLARSDLTSILTLIIGLPCIQLKYYITFSVNLISINKCDRFCKVNGPLVGRYKTDISCQSQLVSSGRL